MGNLTLDRPHCRGKGHIIDASSTALKRTTNEFLIVLINLNVVMSGNFDVGHPEINDYFGYTYQLFVIK